MGRHDIDRASDLATVTEALNGLAARGHNAYLLGFLAGLRLKLRPEEADYPTNPHPQESAQFSHWDAGFGDAILGRGPLAGLADIPEAQRLAEQATGAASIPAPP